MIKGYNDKILRVDLSSGRTWVEQPGEAVWRRYLGGSAMASWYLLRELKPGIDPLGPENMLIFMTSVINGTTISGANRYTAAGKSPLTGGFGEAEAGGWWGPELKAAGFDGIVITGAAEEPVYLWIHDGKVEIRDASHLWGRHSGEVQDMLEAELGDKRIRVLQCGISGENLVRFAAIVNQCRHFHGRSGLGAVMGSKKLKAIAVRGRERVEATDKAGAQAVFRWFKENYDRDNDALHLHGTARGIPTLQADGILPTRNFRDGNFEYFREISGQRMSETILVNRGTCYACAVACKREVAVPELGVTPKFGGPEYETIAANGSLLGIGDLKQIALANQLLSQYVLDSISTGAVIAFAMECFEEGILTKEDCDGLELRFGNQDAAIALIHKIARREGIGDLLAEGVKRAAEKIGRGAERFALHVKGQELPMHEPRGKKGLAIAYAISPTGADHMEAPHDPFYESFDTKSLSPLGILGLIEPVDRMDLGPKKVRAFYYCQQVWSLYNCVGMCDFVGVPIGALALQQLQNYVSAVTGWDMSIYELLKVGERANTMARLFNLREGFTAADDWLPQRMFEGLGNGPLQGERIDPEQLRKALRLYYQMCGWDSEGVPTAAKLAELELEWTRPELFEDMMAGVVTRTRRTGALEAAREAAG
jgi:aldehyde:ferredoxin oxidoreductase